MADVKISALTETTAPATTDVVPVVDLGANATKKVTVANLVKVTVPSGTGLRKVTGGVESASASTLVNADVSASAAIAVTKLAAGSANTVLCGGASNSFRTIVNADVDAAAALAVTKIAAGAANTVLCGGASNSFRTIVNADVNAAAAIAASKLAAAGSTTEVQVNSAGAIGAATNVKAGSGFLSVGASVPATGSLRIRSGVGFGLNALSSGAADLVIAEVNASDGLNLWGTSAAYGNVDIGIGGGAAVRMQSASVSALSVSATEIKVGSPRVGWDMVYASEGRATKAMADANQTLASTEYSRRIIRTTGALTATRTLTFPHPGSEDESYEKIIVNDCTGNPITVRTGTGTTANVAVGATAIMIFTPDGVKQVAA